MQFARDLDTQLADKFVGITLSGNENTGSISTGTSDTVCSDAFNSSGIVPYFLNQFSARERSPVASISSSSLARSAMALGIFA